MSWVIKLGDNYLMTLYWGLIHDEQKWAHQFESRADATQWARHWRKHPDFTTARVVRLVKRETRCAGKTHERTE